jgi:ferredoxin
MGREVEGMSKEELKDKQLFINPSECIDCGACEPECPVNAIFQDEQTAITIEGNDLSVKKNYEFYGLTFES